MSSSARCNDDLENFIKTKGLKHKFIEKRAVSPPQILSSNIKVSVFLKKQ